MSCFFSVFLVIPFLVCDDFVGAMWGCPTLGRPPNSCLSCGSTSSSLPLPCSQVLFSDEMLFVLLPPPHFLYSGVHGSVLHLRASSATSQSGLLKVLSYPGCCLRPTPPLKWWREFQVSAWSIIIGAPFVPHIGFILQKIDLHDESGSSENNSERIKKEFQLYFPSSFHGNSW